MFKNVALLLFLRKRYESNYIFPFRKFKLRISLNRKKKEMLKNEVRF